MQAQKFESPQLFVGTGAMTHQALMPAISANASIKTRMTPATTMRLQPASTFQLSAKPRMTADIPLIASSATQRSNPMMLANSGTASTGKVFQTKAGSGLGSKYSGLNRNVIPSYQGSMQTRATAVTMSASSNHHQFTIKNESMPRSSVVMNAGASTSDVPTTIGNELNTP